MKIKFEDFMESQISGKFIVNPYWLEYLLCLFHQQYFGEIWEEITETIINNNKMIEDVAYGIIGDSLETLELENV